MKKIYLITGRDRFLGQFRKPWFTLDLKIFEQELINAGWQVEILEFHQVVNSHPEIENSIIFYSFSQKMNLREYYKDLIFFLQQRGNLLIPPYELLLCHENKGFQELYKNHLGINSLWSLYLSDSREINDYHIPYPVVLKTLDGSNGRGVFLINNQKELIQKLKSITPSLNIGVQLDLLRRKHFRLKKSVKGWPEYDPQDDLIRYGEYIRPTRNFILQQYIPDLEHDFRVLAVHDHFYITKRHVRKNDFRASGSKLFDFDTGDIQPILDYAQSLSDIFRLPYLSLDIVKTENNFHLLEFQASHFGTNIIKLSKGFYKKEAGKWIFHNAKPDVSSALAKGLVRYLQYLLSYQYQI
jgi:glutathione synthase/RimK-type ligase-like ATP-grasp enzyme